MDASTLSSSEERELAELRLRAYGPDADIDSDPGALARLEQLEAAAHPVSAASDAELDVTDGSHAEPAGFAPRPEPLPAVRNDDPAGVPEGEAAASTTTDESARRAPWLRRVPAWAWFGGAAAALVIATVVWGVDRLTEPQADLSLGRVSTDDPPPEDLEGRYSANMYDLRLDELQQYETHRTLRPWSATNGEGVRCLFVQAPQLDNGIVDACVPRGLDPSLDLPIWPGLPEEISGGLPQGSVLRFVLHGDRVYVWEREAPASAD